MGLRFEANYNYMAGLAPFPPNDADPLQRWFRVHEWRVDTGYTGNLLAVLLNAEPAIPVPATLDYGWMRVRALLDANARTWATKFEVKINGVTMAGHWHTPRMVVLPTGSGIPFTAAQGLMTQALGGTTAVNRWWSCYVIDSQVA
jgi:hypothetical protein